MVSMKITTSGDGVIMASSQDRSAAISHASAGRASVGLGSSAQRRRNSSKPAYASRPSCTSLRLRSTPRILRTPQTPKPTGVPVTNSPTDPRSLRMLLAVSATTSAYSLRLSMLGRGSPGRTADQYAANARSKSGHRRRTPATPARSASSRAVMSTWPAERCRSIRTTASTFEDGGGPQPLASGRSRLTHASSRSESAVLPMPPSPWKVSTLRRSVPTSSSWSSSRRNVANVDLNACDSVSRSVNSAPACARQSPLSPGRGTLIEKLLRVVVTPRQGGKGRSGWAVSQQHPFSSSHLPGGRLLLHSASTGGPVR
ncbi:hypothetical protein SAMN05444365_1195 [Micromonospora pattaloongensis]|uniref:Uncharacterized protein n=1 Tax=Micromonospora pattaloongensis TaxID=405436 RepID=A0A1H3T821_9ACTN|nr:hypothetical protein SAMN05444365_1195 [Micromonospora pattaloongensis]